MENKLKRKLSKTEIFKFIELYRENECLWDCTNKNYKNKKKRNECYEIIRNKLNFENIDEVKKKLKSLRDTYNYEKNKVKNSFKSGSDNIYKPTLSWYNEMAQFLDKADTEQFYNIETNEIEDEMDLSDYDPLYIASSSDHSYNAKYDEFVNVEENTGSSLKRKNEDTKSPKKKKPKKDYVSEYTINSIERLDQFKGEVQDEFYYFGQSVASQLRAITDEKCVAEIQAEIQNCITKKKVEYLNKNSCNDQSNSPSLSHQLPDNLSYVIQEIIESCILNLSQNNKKK